MTALAIAPVDVHDDVALAAWHDVESASVHHEHRTDVNFGFAPVEIVHEVQRVD